MCPKQHTPYTKMLHGYCYWADNMPISYATEREMFQVKLSARVYRCALLLYLPNVEYCSTQRKKEKRKNGTSSVFCSTGRQNENQDVADRKQVWCPQPLGLDRRQKLKTPKHYEVCDDKLDRGQTKRENEGGAASQKAT